MSVQMSDDEIRKLAQRRVAAKKGFFSNLTSYIVINAMLVVIWALERRRVPLVFMGCRLLGRGPYLSRSRCLRFSQRRRRLGTGRDQERNGQDQKEPSINTLPDWLSAKVPGLL